MITNDPVLNIYNDPVVEFGNDASEHRKLSTPKDPASIMMHGVV